ncbi:hypothetical protein niasHT_024341 [Heterodera trifolii]|uniref:Uncharacterized protein n=1 Tax=Heterodera trifolii TaxID=157864 RepID=A0ABD2JMB3_9BILA
MKIKIILILLSVCENVKSVIKKNKPVFNNLNELGEEKPYGNGTTNELQERDRTEVEPQIYPPVQQQMKRGQGNEHILQWFNDYETQQKQSQRKGENAKDDDGTTEENPFKFIKIHINEMANSLTIDAHVTEEKGAVVEICLCDEKYGICDGPFEATENFGGKINPKATECVKFDYKTINILNQIVKKENKLSVLAQFRMNYKKSGKNKAKNAFFGDFFKKGNTQNEKEMAQKMIVRNWHIANLLAANDERNSRRLDREFFLRISFANESKSNPKLIRGEWAVQKSVKFEMIPSPNWSKL